MGEKNDKTLTLLHLRKTFTDYSRVSVSGPQDLDPNRLLPLFNNVMSRCSPVELRLEFKEAPSFTLFFAGILVREIRSRASTEGTEKAAISISEYLEPNCTLKGWHILNSIHFLLLSEDEALVEATCKASLPSTLVKTLYLFFDLPDDSSATDERIQLNDLIRSVLQRICSTKYGIEELARKDDLSLLFIGASSSVRPGNMLWRKTCADVLETSTRCSMTPMIVKYCTQKECIRTYLLNVQSSNLPLQDTADALVTLLRIIKDSCGITNSLLDQFFSFNGFEILKCFLIENNSNSAIVDNILSVFLDIVTSGVEELRPQHCSGLVSLPLFELPLPSGNGKSVRTTAPFGFLFQLFVESSISSLCLSVLHTVHSVYASDGANYFIVEREYPLSTLIDRMADKDTSVQAKMLEVVEYLLVQLGHIPCKEMVSLCVLIKTELSGGRCALAILCTQSAFRMLTVDPILKDAFRDVGLLDALCYAVFHLYETSKGRALSEEEEKLSLLATDLLTVTIKSNVENAKLFGDSWGVRALLDLISTVSDAWRPSALQLLKQLLMQTSSDTYLAPVLSLIHKCALPDQIPLMSEFLKSLLFVLRESHKVRLLFRKSGGYVCLMSLMLKMEGMFSKEVSPESLAVLDVVNLIFKVLTISMRFEPSNSKYFAVEMSWESVWTVLRLSGAFSQQSVIEADDDFPEGELKDTIAACHTVFAMDDDVLYGRVPEGMPSEIFYTCYMMRLLYNMALDNWEKLESASCPQSCSALESLFGDGSVLVHSGAVLSFLQLLPSIHSPDRRWTLGAQVTFSVVLKTLVRTERNQQLMCQIDMPRHLLCVASRIFLMEKHVLLPHLYYMLERLSYQSMHPSQLRNFLRLDMPLCCRSLDPTPDEPPKRKGEGGPLPLSRIRALVSMMTPRDVRLTHSPSFVQFDMIHEGFGCLFIPSLFQNDRVFPPLNGFSFSFWLLVDVFSDKKLDAHPLRLLSVCRVWEGRGPPVSVPCLSIQLSSIDRSLLICTDEFEGGSGDLERDARINSDKLIRIPLVDSIREMEWNHFSVVFSRSVLKPSQVTVYVNGQSIASQRMPFISPTGQNVHVHAVNACIGTLPSMRRPSRLRWRMTSMYILDDAISPEVAARLHRLQPHYIGNLQTVAVDGGPLVSEEKIVVSLNGSATSEITLSDIRGLYNKVDAEMVAPLLGLSPQDHSTSLRVLSNTILHGGGGGRPFGGVVVGYLGMRSFTPRSVPRLLDSMGGYGCLFALLAMSNDSEGVYASLKAIVSATRCNRSLAQSMNADRAYQILAILLEDKGNLLNSHIMHLIFCLVGTLDTSREVAHIPNQQAFEDVLCDLDVWRKAPSELHSMLFEHLLELITDRHCESLSIVRSTPLVCRVLFLLFDQPSLLWPTHDVIFNLLSAILQPPADGNSLLKVGQAIAATVPSETEIGAEGRLPCDLLELQEMLLSSTDRSASPLYMLYIRNRLLNVLLSFVLHSSSSELFREQLVKVLGFDWMLALMASKVNTGTLYLATRLFLSVLSVPSLLSRFREGDGNGGWLSDADSVVRNSAATVLGFSVSAHGGSVGSHVDINPEPMHCAGFPALEHVMAMHSDEPLSWLAMFSLLLGQPVAVPFPRQFNMEEIWSAVFGLSGNSSVYDAVHSVDFCFDALFPLCSMIRSCVHGGTTAHALTAVQVLSFFYQNSDSFFTVAHTEEFVVMLYSSLIPEKVPSRDSLSSPDEGTVSSILSNPAVTAIVEFLRKILVDEVQLVASKGDRLVDSLFESIGESRRLEQSVLRVLVQSVLDSMAADLLASPSLPPHLTPQPRHITHNNIFTFCLRVSDALWQGLFPPTCIDFLKSFYRIHALAAKHEGNKLDTMCTCIMRCVLYLLSRPIDCSSVQLSVLDTLGSLISKKYVFSGAEPWFLACLVHLVFMLSVTPDILVDDGPFSGSSAQVSMCSSRVWSDVLVPRLAVLEQSFRRKCVPELNAARALLADAAVEWWGNFVDQVTTHSTSNVQQLQNHISSKITKVTWGLHRFGIRRSQSTSSALREPLRSVSVSSEVVLLWLRLHVSIVRQLLPAQSARYHEWHSHVRKWAMQDWNHMENELTRERGIWGPDHASHLDKYKLDTTEGPCRIRKKMIPNREFYRLYPYRPHLELPGSKSLRAKVAISKDSKKYFEALKSRREKTIDDSIIETSNILLSPTADEGKAIDIDRLNSSLIRRVSSKKKNEDKENGEEKDEDEEEEEGKDEKDIKMIRERKRGPDNQTLLRLLEQGEQLHSMFRCARIQGLETNEGLLLFGKEHYYIVDGFTLLKTKEIRDLEFLPSELHDPIIPYTATGGTAPPTVNRLCSKFSYSAIREVHKRRYLLQPIALEVFSSDGRNYLLAFPKRMRDRVHEKMLSVATSLTDTGRASVGGQKASMAMEQSGRVSLLNSLIGEQSVTQRWLLGEISNFQYIMHLNTLAGRSYNDLSQYPVFPWVLADYTSDTLDLTNPKTFRDLAKPMGAQSPERLQQFLRRYNEWDDPTGEIPPYMFGTHYSSAMIVVSYLVRLEPFTQQFLSLQGGHFDLADRMFHSVGDAWLSASRNNMADVKELIPEFFTLPEMFVNSNNYDLGVKQNGVALDDVILPPWAKGSPIEFIRLHRQALECDYVSANIHKWIDLVFGYKQNGENAVQSNNVFHHLFYEGSVDFLSIDDPLIRNATIGFVNNFGQIPSQLFKKPHPQKKVAEGYCSTPGVTTPRLFYHSLHNLKPPTTPIKELRCAVGSLQLRDKGTLIAVEQNRLLLSNNRYLAWGFPDRSLRIGNIETEKSTAVLELSDSLDVTCVACGDDTTIFCGSSDGCVSVWLMGKRSSEFRRRKTLDGHSDAVTCLVVCSPHSFVVSASRDCSVIIWHQSELTFIRQLALHPAPISAVAVNDTTGDIATSCLMNIYVWTMNGQLLATLSTGDQSHMILSITFSTLNEWDSDSVILCGTSEGVTNIFSCVLVKNDGSVQQPRMQRKSVSSVSTVQARLERQKRRLKGTSMEIASCQAVESVSDPQLQPPQDSEYVHVLAHRASLTAHTAFARPDNPHPAPVTCILVGRDHKSVYIGDGVGRVWNWKMDEETRHRCTQCAHKFALTDKRHLCRNCGQLFCAKCTQFESHINVSRPVRVCQGCFVRLRAQPPS